MTSNAPGAAPGLPSVYTDGFPLAVLSRDLIDGYRKAAQAETDRFWSTPERYAADPTREILDLTFSGPRLINYLGFATAHFPHTVTAEYYDEQVRAWYPFTAAQAVGSPVTYTIADAAPPRVNPLATSGVLHPQHQGPGHWTPVSWRVRPVQVKRLRLVLVRNPVGYPPADSSGNQAAYSLGIRDFQPGYRITSRADIPRHGDLQTRTDTFASSTDLLGSRVGYSLREERPGNVLDGSDATIWRCSPQPVNYAVVNFYADTRNPDGTGAVIDRFFLDPTTVGAHLNLYYSNDEPDLDFAASDDPLLYPIAQRFGGGPTAYYPPASTTATAVTYNGDGAGFTDIDNAYLQFDPTRPWWLGMEMTATADANGAMPDTLDLHHPWLSFGLNTLRQHGNVIEFVTEHGEAVTLPLPAEHTRQSRFHVAVTYTAAHQIVLRYALGDGDPVQVTQQILPLAARPDLVSLARYPDETNPGIGGITLHALVLKPVPPTDGEITAFFADGPGFVSTPDYAADDTAATTNALLRMVPWMSAADTNPDGLVGGPGDRYAGTVWTPIFHDYSLRRGFLELPPTKAKHWKFEFTKLVPETYESFVPIRREVKLFTAETVRRYTQTGGATGPTNPRDGGGGIATMLDLTNLNRYSDALDVLAGRGSSQASTVLAAADLASAQRIADLGWIWSFQPWHLGHTAPRFVDTSVHHYEKVVVEHRTKVGYFAGLKSLQAYRVDYLADDDTARYTEHFLDDTHLRTLDGAVLTDGQVTAVTSSAVVESRTLRSHRPVRAVQMASLQSDAEQILPDDGFLNDTLSRHWNTYGDAVLDLDLQTRSVTVSRGYRHRTYGEIETDPAYGTYAALEGRLYGEIEGGQSNGIAGGGLASEAVTPSASGRVYVAARVSAAQTLSAPVIAEVVSATDGTVLASTQRVLRAGETQVLTVGYTVGSDATPLHYSDLEGTLYGDLDATTYGDHDSVPIKGDIYVRVLQTGATTDSFTVHRLSLFDDVISWEFSLDGGTTYWEARDIRNDPNGVLSLPPDTVTDPDVATPGTALRWRLKMFREGVAVNALAIRPWYAGLLAGIPAHDGMHLSGPNRSVQDQLPEISIDPMWQSWHNPIPRWWFENKIFTAARFGETPSGGGVLFSLYDDVLLLPGTG